MSQELIRLEVSDGDDGERIDRFIALKNKDLTRQNVKKMLQAGLCLRNGQTCQAKDRVISGDVIELIWTTHNEHRQTLLKPIEMSLDILFEDEDLLVLNKAAGVVVHPGAGTKEPTLIEGLLYHLGKEADELPGQEDRPGVVHRLDRDTSGALVFAKNELALRHLAGQFKAKTNWREYVALLDGVMQLENIKKASYLVRDPRNRIRFCSVNVGDGEKPPEGSRYAESLFTRRAVFGNRLTLASVKLSTGRTHQIRVHAQSLGLAIWGDKVYFNRNKRLFAGPPRVKDALDSISRQLLHARVLGFEHPRTGRQLAFEAPLPEDFRNILGLLKKCAHD